MSVSTISKSRKIELKTSQRAAPYQPFGAAKKLWKCKDQEVLISGPAGTGKTRAILEKIFALCLKYPGSRHLLCRKTRASMTQSVLVTFEEKVLPPNSPIKAGPARAYRQSYKVGDSEIVIGGLDNPERTFSTEYDTVVVFEAIEITEAEWDALQRSLRNGKMRNSPEERPYHQAIADTNPGSPAHWLKIRSDKQKKMTHFKSRHEDNPQFYDHVELKWTHDGEQYIRRLSRLTGHLRKRLYEGKWVAAEGVVYEDYDPRKHNLSPRQTRSMRELFYNGNGRMIVSIDWGYTHPGVMQLWGIDSDRRMYLLLEIFQTKRTVTWWRDQCKDWCDTYPNIEAVVVDPAQPGHIQEFENVGIPVVAGYNDIIHGVKALQDRFVTQDDGSPRIKFSEEACEEKDPLLEEAKTPCTTLEELPAYTWKIDQNGRPMKKERPNDENNHGMDAMRYACAYVDSLQFLTIQEGSGYSGGANEDEQPE